MWKPIAKDTKNGLVKLAFDGSFGPIYDLVSFEDAHVLLKQHGTFERLADTVERDLSMDEYDPPDLQIQTLIQAARQEPRSDKSRRWYHRLLRIGVDR